MAEVTQHAYSNEKEQTTVKYNNINERHKYDADLSILRECIMNNLTAKFENWSDNVTIGG